MHDPELQDPESEDPDEVWFDADELASASQVELGGETRHGSELLGHTGALEQLRAVMQTPGISLAELPGWPMAGERGQGLGPELAALVGELRPGDVLLFGGRGRAVGRSSLLAQLGDGLALRRGDTLSPVVWIVDGAPALWRARSLARWSGLDARTFVDADASAHASLVAYGESEWMQLEQRQRFVAAAQLLDADARDDLLTAIARWRRELRTEAGEVWPIVIVDPLEQLCEPGQGSHAALGLLAELAAAHQLIVLASHDEHDEHDDAGQTRALDRHARARLRLHATDEDTLELELCHRHVGPRGRVRLAWARASGRIVCRG